MTDYQPHLYASPVLADLILEKSESFDPFQEALIADPSVTARFVRVSEQPNV